MFVLSRDQVREALDLDRLVDAVGEALSDLSAGRASMPPRGAASVPNQNGLLLAMPAYLPSAGALTTKLVSLFPLNRDRPTHQAIICCFDPANGAPIALMDGTYITAMRTAAASVLATRLLAPHDARRVCVVGTGAQARAHLTMFAREQRFTALALAGRDHTKVMNLVRELAAEGLAVDPASTIEAGVRSADVVCATTHADRPVVRREWLRPGVHVNSVGYNSSGEGEVDVRTVADSLLVVESRDAALASPPAGAIELRRAIEAGAIQARHVHAELGELVAGSVSGRSDDRQITLYKGVGVAVEDAAAAALVLRSTEGMARTAGLA